VALKHHKTDQPTSNIKKNKKLNKINKYNSKNKVVIKATRIIPA
jgi:hypothetical protein